MVWLSSRLPIDISEGDIVIGWCLYGCFADSIAKMEIMLGKENGAYYLSRIILALVINYLAYFILKKIKFEYLDIKIIIKFLRAKI